MKRFAIGPTLLLCLPVVVVVGIATITISIRNKDREQRRDFYSHPFTPRLELERGEVPGYATPGLFQVEARCFSIGGRGQSHWLLRSQLFDISSKVPRELWNSQKLLAGDEVNDLMRAFYGRGSSSAQNPPRPHNHVEASWRFLRRSNKANHLKLVTEAVCVPYFDKSKVDMTEYNWGQSCDVREVTRAQIMAARQQVGARYFRKSLLLEARDDDQHLYSKDAMKP